MINKSSWMIFGKMANNTYSYELYTKHISPSDKLLVVGSSISITHDPTLLFACSYINSKGEITVVDPQTSDKPIKTHDYVAGCGNISWHLKEIDDLRQKGLRLAVPRWLGLTASCQHTTLEDRCINTIIDHNTSVSIGGLAEIFSKKERKERLAEIFKEYYRVLVDGGKIILQTNNERYDFDQSVLRKNGFNVKTFRVVDNFRIDVPLETYEDWISRKFDEMSEIIIKSRLKLEKNTAYLEFNRTDHYSPDLYIATKLAH